MYSLTFEKAVIWLLSAWAVAALCAVFAGFTGFLLPFVSLLLIVPVSLSVALVSWYLYSGSKDRTTYFLSLFLSFILLCNFVGTLVPEHGFDAVWYHLPVISAVVTTHHFVYLPELYQSVNPQLSDVLLALGYQVLGEFGTKFVAFSFVLTLIAVVGGALLQKIDRTWSLLITSCIALFQVITWQGGSAYIDVAKALWEVGAVYVLMLLEKPQQSMRTTLALSILYATLCGMSIATKEFSLVLLPFFIILYWMTVRNWKRSAFVTLILLCVSAPFYIFSWLQTGSPITALQQHTDRVSELTGFATWSEYLVNRTVTLPVAPVFASFLVRDYTSPLFFLIFYWFCVQFIQKKLSKTQSVVFLFVVLQLSIWWFLPPLSTRYALSGFILGFVFSILHFVQTSRVQWQKHLLFVLLCSTALSMTLPRVLVAYRDMQYVLGYQTKEVYLSQFLDGNIDGPLKKWHGSR